MQAPSLQISPEPQPDKPWGLVLSGGGFGAAYGVGVLRALQQTYKMRAPSVVVGSSASAPAACLYASGQVEAGLDVWANDMSDPDMMTFIDGMKVPKVHIEEIVSVIRQRLDLLALKDDPSQVYFAGTDFETGEPVMLNTDLALDANQFYRMMSGSMAIDGNPVKVGSRQIIDGDLSGSEAQKVDFVRGHDIENVVLIRNTHPTSIYEMMRIIGASNDQVKKIYRQNKMDLLVRLQEDERTKIIEPSRQLVCGLFRSNAQADIVSTLELGYQDAKSHKTLDSFSQSA